MAYLKAFTIPEDYQEKIIEAHRKLESAYADGDIERQRAILETRLQRVKDLYEWGHKSKQEYLADYSAIRRDLQQLAPMEPQVNVLDKLVLFLRDITAAWEQATPTHRNQLADSLFEVIWIKDKKVVAVTPRPEFKPFFDLQYDGLSHGVLQMRPRWDSNPRSPAGQAGVLNRYTTGPFGHKKF